MVPIIFKHLLFGTVLPGFHNIASNIFLMCTKAVLDNSDLNSKPFEFITKLNKAGLKLNSPKGNYRKCTRTVWRNYFVILGFEELNAHCTVDSYC